MMKTKTLIPLMVFLAAAILVVPASCASPTDWAYATITHIRTVHPETSGIPVPVLTSDFSNYPVNMYSGDGWMIEQDFNSAPGPVTVATYADVSCSLRFEGWVSWEPQEVTETYFKYETPEPEPESRDVTLLTTIVNPQYRYIWNGNGYVLNPNMNSYWLEGRFYVVYPSP